MHELLNLNHQLIFYDFKIRDNFSRTSGFCSRSSKIKSFWLVHCVCVCVCVCVYTLPPVSFFRLHDFCDIREKFGSMIFFCEYFYRLLPSSFISISESIIFHLQRRKLQPTAYWREKRYDLMFALEKMIYIDTGYKSAHYKNRQ